MEAALGGGDGVGGFAEQRLRQNEHVGFCRPVCGLLLEGGVVASLVRQVFMLLFDRGGGEGARVPLYGLFSE